MNILHFPWLELSIATPLVGAGVVHFISSKERAQKLCVFFASITLLCTLAAWYDFSSLNTFEAHDKWDLVTWLLGDVFIVVDELSAPLIPMVALVYLATSVATMRAKAKRFSFSGSLLSEAILLATLSCRDSWGIIILLILGTLQPGIELWRRKKPMRVYVFHMILFAALLVGGQLLVTSELVTPELHVAGVALLMVAILLRNGVFPLHCWMTDLFEHASFGTALLFVTPMVGAYAAVRLVMPIAPDWILRSIAIASIATAFYAAGMALVQTEARRFFCFLHLSHSSLVLVGVEIATPIGLTGALCVWLSVTLALTGLGLTLRSIEARCGSLSLKQFHGLAEQTPLLAGFFLITGLASAGFPGSFGFIATEVLVNGVIDTTPAIGLMVVLVAMLNGIAILKVYFRIFTGTRHPTSIPLQCRPAERLAVMTLTILILLGGVFAQPGIASRYHAAVELMKARESRLASFPDSKTDSVATSKPVGKSALTLLKPPRQLIE